MTTPTSRDRRRDARGPDPPARPLGGARRPTSRSPSPTPPSPQALAAERDEPAWLRDDRLAAAAAFDALPVEANRLYTPYVDLRAADLFGARPYVRTATRRPRAARRSPRARRADRAARGRRRGARPRPRPSPRRGVTLETLAAALARDPERVRAELIGTALPADDKLAQLARGFWSQGVRLARAGRRPPGAARSSSAGRSGTPVAPSSPGPSSGSARAPRHRSWRSRSRPARLIGCAAGEPVPQALFGGTTEVRLGRSANLRLASIQDLPGRDDRVPAPGRARSAPGRPSAGRSPSSAGASSARGSTTASRATAASVEQVEIVFGGRDQLFDLTSLHPPRRPGHDRQPALQGRPPARRPGLHQGPHLDREDGPRDRQLPRRVRDAPRQAEPLGHDPEPGDRPAGLPPGRPRVSVGPIDPTQLFYLESRGITPDEARKFIVLGFLEPVVARVPLEAEQRAPVEPPRGEVGRVALGTAAA